MLKKDSGIREYQRLEEEVWIHYAGFTTPAAPHRSDKPEEVTCPSCIRELKKDPKRT